MSFKVRLTAVAAALCLASVSALGTVVSDAPSASAPATFSQSQPTGAGETPLMSALEQTSIGPALEHSGFRFYGWVEGSYEYNFMRPSNAVPHSNQRLGGFDNFQTNNPFLNQLDFNIERNVDLSTGRFDIGGRAELLFGQDARWIRSYGLLDFEKGADPYTNSPGSENQFDIPQAYVDFGVPVGTGLRLRFGKFELFKPTNPNDRLTYSDTYAYFLSFPFTLTGISAKYAFSPQISFEGGISRGWNDSLEDNNSAIDGFGRLVWSTSDASKLTFGFITGPELPHDDSHWTTALDLAYFQQVTEKLTLLVDAVYGCQADGSTGVFGRKGIGPIQTPPGSPAFSGIPLTNGRVTTRPGYANTLANWYGVSGDAIYALTPMIDLVGRIEWFRDEDGFLSGITDHNLYEATIGATIKPLYSSSFGSNLKIRPEVRYDYSTSPSPLNYFFGPHAYRHDQFTFAIDAIFNF